MKLSKKYFIWSIMVLVLLVIFLLSLLLGQYEISVKNALLALFGNGSSADVNIVQGVRLSRAIAGIFTGITLSLSGIFIRSSLSNPLADSGVIGIQAGGSVFALLIILYFPTSYLLLPPFAFIGGIIAFLLTISFTRKSEFSSLNIILSGVAINAFFTAIIGLLTILNATKLQGALTYLNGSLANTTSQEATYIMLYSLILIIGSYFLIPVLNILKLDDVTMSNLGVNPGKYRLIAALFGVFCASITVAFVGIISFVGIIVPNIAEKITGNEIKDKLITSSLLGAIFILGADLLQRIIFAPLEIPVGLIIGLVSAPIYLIILRSAYNGKI